MIRATRIKRFPQTWRPAQSGGLGRLGVAFTVTSGIAKASSSVTLGQFKAVQRALNQWWIKIGASKLALVAVDGQIGDESVQGVRNGIIAAVRRGNAISMQEPGGVYDVAQNCLAYAQTFASLAGVDVDVDPSCRTTDWRENRPTCSVTTVAPAGTLYTPREPSPVPDGSGTPTPGGDPVVTLPTRTPEVKASSASGLALALGLGVLVFGGIAYSRKNRKRG